MIPPVLIEVAAQFLVLSSQRPDRYRAAEASLRKALALRPDYVDAHVTLGSVLETTGRPAEAIPELHQATVYRALDVLVEEGLAKRTEIAGRALYEIASEHLHHHVVCTSCGAVRHVHDEAVHNALQRVARESGYALAEEELTFSGLCPGCASAPPS